MKIKDIFFFLIYMIISAGIAFGIYFFPFEVHSDAYAEIIRDGVTVSKLLLSENSEYISPDNAFCVRVDDGYAFVAYSNCPDKCCVAFGKTNTPMKTIVCVPNRLVVKVVYPTGDDSDAIAG
ncbi:MAG: NusG domain II-containing protein [Oscillospiraceae bacterium]|nr:NusG domain II-containing protein [Oscillospiraceae bacterium]